MASSVAILANEGPPAGGKSETLRRLQAALRGRILFGSEVATAIFGSGYPVPTSISSPEAMIQLQRAIYEYGLGLEDNLIQLAIQQKARVLLLDRALPTGAAYMPGGRAEFYRRIARQSEESLLARYRGVLYFPSLATFNSGLYEEVRLSNPHRRESVAEAVELDRRTWDAWVNHPNVIRLPGEDGLDAIYEAALGVLSQYLFREVERTWRLLSPPGQVCGYLKHERIEQYYLSIVEGGEIRNRRIEDDSGLVRCVETEKSGSGLSRGETEVEITRARYETHKASARGHIIQKDRFSFVDHGGLISLDIFAGHLTGLYKLEREFDSNEEAHRYGLGAPWENWDPVELTGDKRYSNAHLALYGLPQE